MALTVRTSFSAAPSRPFALPPPSSASRPGHSSCSASCRRCRCAPAAMLLDLCGTTLLWTGSGNGTLCGGSSLPLGTWSASWTSPCLGTATGSGSVSCCACCSWSVWTGTSCGSESGPCWAPPLVRRSRVSGLMYVHSLESKFYSFIFKPLICSGRPGGAAPTGLLWRNKH